MIRKMAKGNTSLLMGISKRGNGRMAKKTVFSLWSFRQAPNSRGLIKMGLWWVSENYDNHKILNNQG